MDRDLESIIKITRALKKEVKEKYKADVIGIFGSFVRGEQKDTSDIDILVKFEKDATLLDFGGLVVFLKENLQMEVDVVPIDAVKKEIQHEIFKEAIYL